MRRVLVFAYGVMCYLVFFGTFLYATGFIGGFAVPTRLDGRPTVPPVQAVCIDLGLLALFAAQHSVMARPWFKRWWTRIIPAAAERSTYVLFSSLALVLLFVTWQPIGGVVWQAKGAIAKSILLCLFALGWALVFASTLLINHFDLFGLRQVWLYLRGREYTHPKFATPLLYKFVRHPLYVGWLLAFWSATVMTVAHLLFAVMTTAYILMAIRWEERDLLELHGEPYRRYRESVPMLVPALAPYEETDQLEAERATA